ncbi:MAG: YegS/Rv2252/BmrU family lipid kinase [Acidobacteriota bacterium]
MSETLVVVNPTAGGGRAGAAWAAVAAEAARMAEIRVAQPQGAAAARAAVQDAVARGCERVVAFGGDGTAHLVANALLNAGVGERVTLGVVPAGTGSDLARALAIPRHPLQALRRALLGPPAPFDAGSCSSEGGSFFFVNIASAGVGGLVDQLVNAIPRRGPTTFLLCTLRALRRYRCVPVRVFADGEGWYEGPILLLAVANGTTFGKGMRFAPDAKVDDGLFDLVLVGEVAGLELLRRLPQVYLGRHLGAKPVHACRARQVHLEPLAELPVFDVDGETYPSGPATFTLLPAALRVAGNVAT